VLGQPLTELTEAGAKQQTYVYANGALLAQQSFLNGNEYVTWEHRDPEGVTVRGSDATGQPAGSSAELDALGANAGLFKPLTWAPARSSGQLVPFAGLPDMNSNGGCTQAGVSKPCDYSFWGSNTADLPGFGTHWGNFADLGAWEHELRLTYTLARNGFVLPTREGFSRDTDWSSRDNELSLDSKTQSRREPPIFNESRFRDCLQKKFTIQLVDGGANAKKSPGYGINRSGGFFWGMRPDGQFISVQTSTTAYDESDIKSRKGNYLKHYGGFTDPRDPGTNFVASNIAMTASMEFVQAVWVHELGNSLAGILSRLTGHDMSIKAKNPNLLRWDSDSGSAFEECVYGGKVIQNLDGSVSITSDPGHP
jgi:hypothetical protein